MVYIGFHIDDELREKIKILKFMTGKNQSSLITEGLHLVVDKHSEDFEKFKQYAKQMDD